MRPIPLLVLLAACGTVDAPSGVTLEPSSPRTGDALRLVFDAPDADAVDVRWTIDGEAVPDLDDAVQVDASRTTKGERWAATVAAFKGARSSVEVTVEATIGDTPPTAESAQISPASPTTRDALTCAGLGFADADADPEGWTFSWVLDGAPAGDGPTFEAGRALRGDRVGCAATPVADGVSGDPVEVEVVVGDAPPELESVTFDPPDPTRSTPLLAIAAGAADPDGDPVEIGWAWTVDGAAVDEASDTLSNTAFVRGQTVAVFATPVAGGLEGVPATASVVIGNAAPNAPTLRVTPAGTVFDADDLHCEIEIPALDPDGDDVTYAFAWSRNGVAWTGAVATTTWPGDTLPASATSPGDRWECAATANDGEDDGDVATASVEVSRCALVEHEILASQSLCVSPSTGSVWRDNLVRAYTDTTLRIYGWMAFDLGAVDPDGTVVEASLELHEEWGSIQGEPRMAVVESSTVGWTRSSGNASTFAIGDVVSDTFTAFTLRSWNTFPIDPERWDWAGALERGEATLGVYNEETSYSFVYFHGADARSERAKLQLVVEVCE